MQKIELTTLPKTWLIDIDGVILKHNGYKQAGEELLPGVKEFWRQICEEDFVVLLTARAEEMREPTLALLKQYQLRYNVAIFSIPTGERICINDKKPSGLFTSYSINLLRDQGLVDVEVLRNSSL